jgi:hypothetical protein
MSGAGGAHTGLFGRPTILREEDKDKAGGGEGGEGKSKGEDDETKFNRILAARERSNEKKLAKLISEGVAAALLAAGVKPKVEGEEPPPDDKDDKSNKSKPRVDPVLQAQLDKMSKEVTEAKKIAESEKALRIKADKRAEADEERALLTSRLTGKVRPEQLEDVVEILSKRLVRDPEDASKILWKGDKWRDGEDIDNSENFQAVDAGLVNWTESAKGKSYRPARDIGGGGSGNPGGAGRGPKGKTDDPATDAEVGMHIFKTGGGGR